MSPELINQMKAVAAVENELARENWDGPLYTYSGSNWTCPHVAERRREVLAAHEGGMSCSQIANAKRLNISTVKSDLREARRMRAREAMQ